VLFSLLMLERLDEVQALCRECEATIDDPFVLTHCAYAMAIMHLRFFPPERRDLDAARFWTEKALACTRMRPSSTDRTVNLAFLTNTMALVETRLGRVAQAIAMLDDALVFLQREAPESFVLEGPILYRNRAQLHDRLGRTDAAIDDLKTLLRYEFSSARSHLQLAIILRRRGRYEQALDESTAAIAWSPPWPAAHHHRVLVYADMGCPENALADLDRVLTLDPGHVDTFTDRATLLYQLGRFDESCTDVERGLTLNPTSARLLCLRGFLERREGRESDARRSFAAAIEQTPPLPDRVAAVVRRWLAARGTA
jgi:tetratricopeptide (TPR) repeat protein